MRITVLSTCHAASDGRIFEKECRSLAAAGHEVRFVVPHDADTEVDGVQIVALSRPRSRWDRWLRTLPALASRALRDRADIYHFHDPEILPVGLMLQLLGRTAVYDVHEDYRQRILDKQYLPRPLRRPIAGMVALLESVAGRCLGGIVAATPDIAAHFSPERTCTVRNFPIQGDLQDALAAPYQERENLVVFTGVVGVQRAAGELFAGIELARRSVDLRFEIAGRYNTPAEELTLGPAADRAGAILHGWLKRAELTRLINRARVGVTLAHPVPAYVVALPVKLYEYMAAGLPVVASDFPVIREIVVGARCGLVVDPLRPEAIAEAIVHLLTHPEEAEAMGERARAAIRDRYSWEREAEQLLRFYGVVGAGA